MRCSSDLHAGAARFVQAPQRVRRHERMVAVRPSTIPSRRRRADSRRAAAVPTTPGDRAPTAVRSARASARSARASRAGWAGNSTASARCSRTDTSVRKSSAPSTDPASDGASDNRDRCARPDSTPSGMSTIVVASPAPTIEPLVPTSRRMPNGNTGIGSSTASTSLSVFAVAVTVAVPDAFAPRSASRRAVRAPLASVAAGGGVRADGREARGLQSRPTPSASQAGSCAPSSAPRPRRLR